MNTLPPALPQRRAHLRLAWDLGLAAIVANLLLQPYQMALMPHAYARVTLPLWQVMALQALQSGVMCFLLGWAGLILGAPHGLGAPWLQAWIEHRRPTLRGHWLLAIGLGVMGALIVIALMHAGTGTATYHAGNAGTGMAWRGALASFYGGIVEETLCRLFLVGLFVWLLALLNHRQASGWMYVAAIILAAVLFGAGHLPAMLASGGHPTAFAVTRIVGLNAIVGIFFGGVYWKYGLEHAMVAHFSADLVLHVLLPMLVG
jgi:hypothetical protein